VTLRWLPISGYTDPLEEPWNGLRSLTLPAITLGLALAAVVTRTLRSSLLEALTRDYVRTARAKGLSEWRVVWGHVLRKRADSGRHHPRPAARHADRRCGHHGVRLRAARRRRLVVDAVFARDYPLVQGRRAADRLGFIVSNLVVDVLYGWIDPGSDLAERRPGLERPAPFHAVRWKVLRRAARARLAPFGAGVMLLAVLGALAAPLVAPYDPLAQNLATRWPGPIERIFSAPTTWGAT